MPSYAVHAFRLYHPVHYQQEDCRREYTALTDTGLNLEGIVRLSIMNDFTTRVFVQVMYDGDEFGGEKP